MPPDSAAEPASNPAAGLYPISVARPTATPFCTTRFATATSVSTTSITPPIASSRKLADRPTVVKKTISSVSRAARSNLISVPVARISSVIAVEAMRPPVTGSGMPYSRSQWMRLFTQRPRNRTRMARISVWWLSRVTREPRRFGVPGSVKPTEAN